MPDVTTRLKAGSKPKLPTLKQDKAACDRMASKIVKSRGFCEFGDAFNCRDQCEGMLHWAHVIRRPRSGIRTDTSNARCLCAHHHYWLDNHEEEWVAWLGIDEIRRLRAIADAFTLNRCGFGSSVLFWRAERARLSAIVEELGL